VIEPSRFAAARLRGSRQIGVRRMVGAKHRSNDALSRHAAFNTTFSQASCLIANIIALRRVAGGMPRTTA
jgi:hypothetical protein